MIGGLDGQLVISRFGGTYHLVGLTGNIRIRHVPVVETTVVELLDDEGNVILDDEGNAIMVEVRA